MNTKFSEAFQYRWNHSELPSTWVQGVNTFTAEQVREAVAAVLLDSSNSWPPTLPEFLSLCRYGRFNIGELFDRFMSGEKAKTHLERLIFQSAHHANVKRKAIGDDERTFKAVCDKWLKRRDKGTLPQDVPALPRQSVVSAIDKLRESTVVSPNQFRKGSVMARIAMLGKGNE